MAGERSLLRKDALAEQGTVLAQIADRCTRHGFVKADEIEFGAGLQLVASEPAARREVQRCRGFLAVRVGNRILKVAALGGLRRDLVGTVPVRLVAVAKVDESSGNVQQRAVEKVCCSRT